MTSGSTLISRVRTNILEKTANQRTDAEILQWLNDATVDYVVKVPPESVPSLTVYATFSGSSLSLPSDLFRLLSARLNHTISGSTTGIEPATILLTSEEYFATNYLDGIGAYARVANGAIEFGPSAIAGTVSYQKHPTSMSTSSSTFALSIQHEEPIVNRASALACAKINDDDRQVFEGYYNSRIEAELKAYQPQER